MDIFIASAFFTETEVIDELLSKGCHVRIVVRLGFPTPPIALEKLLASSNVEARFFTNSSFHPKLYIFGDKTILLGSANLTSSAILSNQEVMIGVDFHDVRFLELQQLFDAYWAEADVLTPQAIKEYKNIYNRFSQISKMVKQLDDTVTERMGDISFSNIKRGKKKSNKKSIFLNSYRKSYQEAVTAFKRVAEIYQLSDRKVDPKLIPERLEIDSFFSFVRDIYARQDTWRHQPIGWDQHRKSQVRTLVNEWLATQWEHFEAQIVPINYPLIKRVLGSKEAIETASLPEIVDALCVLHSFHDRFRFFAGGLETLKSTFISHNDERRVKNTLTYLLFGAGDAVGRMADCIYDSEYKLNEFGKSNVQELIGWINKENLPVINGRTTKVLRYFGNDIRQIDE